MSTVRVRHLETKDEYDLPSDERALLVPYEMPEHAGACRPLGETEVAYMDREGEHLARTRPTRLGECHPGERVLLEFDGDYVEAPGWWLCEVEAVDGEDIASS